MESEKERRDDGPAAPTYTNGGAPEPGVDDDGDAFGEDVATDAIAVDHFENLAGSLLWRIGRAYEDGPVTVRVGLATSAPLFADLPRLRAASDHEVEAAVHDGEVQVEWVGPRLGGRS